MDDSDQDQEPRSGRLRVTAVSHAVFNIGTLPPDLNTAALNIQRAVGRI